MLVYRFPGRWRCIERIPYKAIGHVLLALWGARTNRNAFWHTNSLRIFRCAYNRGTWNKLCHRYGRDLLNCPLKHWRRWFLWGTQGFRSWTLLGEYAYLLDNSPNSWWQPWCAKRSRTSRLPVEYCFRIQMPSQFPIRTRNSPLAISRLSAC